ncbi:leucine-rich_repeat domain-containing protein [Hexamita inflata]|uniref:Leucine-rich repeat domain-containing protein n=1 Tax=Hexamita inflata TaxID=28002 RepID=A0AA86QTE4_9EUKA|nr:leucine-rich repeat domain-containing protein [Hexamita inflata]CAI9965684.1 leucine-rich repeat domain-containing protein [Hexamita inflata]
MLQNVNSQQNYKNVQEIIDQSFYIALSDHEQQIIKQQIDQIKAGVFKIEEDPEIKSIEFIKLLNIQKLELISCNDMVPKLESKRITELHIENTNYLKLNELQLENLEIFKYYKLISEWSQVNYNFVQEIVQFNNLKQLYLDRCRVDIGPLQQMISLTKVQLNHCSLEKLEALRPLVNLTDLSLFGNDYIEINQLQYLTQLTKLDLGLCGLVKIEALSTLINLTDLFLYGNEKLDISPLQHLTNLITLNLDSCGLVSLEALRPLVNLTDLSLYGNEYIEITPIQYLKQLTKLNLRFCGLTNLEILRPLSNLTELQVAWNYIVYLQPLLELKQLKKLDAQTNKLVDEVIKQHPNSKRFILFNQQKPSKEELKQANIALNINFPITPLRQIQKQINNLKYQFTIFKQKIEGYIKNDNLVLLQNSRYHSFKN